MSKKYPDENQLLNQMAIGNELAFKAIYDTYSKEMFLYAMNVFRKKEVCEDIVQEVFVTFWSRRKKVKITHLKSYLFKSVKYQIFNHLRNRKINTEELTRANIIDLSMNISQELEFHELEKMIKDQVEKLPTRCQQIFILSRYQHKSNKEIALELDISLQAVKNQISKGIQSIKQNLNQEEAVFYFLLFTFGFI